MLARTCRTFKEPALDVLWSELVDLAPLVRCLPDACQSSIGPVCAGFCCGLIFVNDYSSISQCYSFKRHLDEREWGILRSYARRIWHINGYSNLQGWLDNDNFIAVCNPPVADPLFPNLRSLYWQGMAMIPVAHIAVPSLTTLDLHFTHRHVPVLKDFLDAVGNLCPNIKRFRIHIFHCQIFHEDISSYISRWANLRILDFHGVVVNADTISRLSEISTLAHISFTLIPGMTDWIPSGSVSVFPRLIHLETTSESLEPVMGLLSCTRLPVLRNLIVICPQRPSKDNFKLYMTTVRNVCSLSSLSNFMFFNNKSPRFPLFGTPDDESDDQLTLDDLRPCMDFFNLCQLRLDVKWSVALTDSDLLTLVSAWPHMQVLHVNERWGWRTTGGITLRGLLRLLEKRRSLSFLCVAIHTESFTALSRELDEGLVPSSPLWILLADSDIQAADVPALVDAFVELGPYLRFFIAVDGLVGRRSREGALDRRREWRRVLDGVSERVSGPSVTSGG